MGSIIASKRTKEGKVILQVELDYEEALQLRGQWDNIFLFPEGVATTQANLSCRGKNEATKYFLIPRELRQDLKFSRPVKCHRTNLDHKAIFIYVVDTRFGNLLNDSQS